MADPVTGGLLALGTGTSILGGLMGAQGAEAAGESRYQEAMYRAAIADQNRDLALKDADYEYRVGESQAQQVGTAGAVRKGAIIAGQGASGLDVGFGSNLRIQQSQQTVNSLDEATVRSNAARRAYGHEIEATNASNSAQLYRMGGSAAREEASTNAATSILGTATSVSGRWLQASQAGMFGRSATPASQGYGSFISSIGSSGIY